MALSIKSERTEYLARKVAQRTGESVTAAVTVALEEKIARLDKEMDVERRVAEHMAWLRSLGPVPPGPSREEIDAEMYDEYGLPR